MTGNDRFLQILAPEIYKRMMKCAAKFVTEHGYPEKARNMSNWNFFVPNEILSEKIYGSPFDPDYDDSLDNDGF